MIAKNKRIVLDLGMQRKLPVSICFNITCASYLTKIEIQIFTIKFYMKWCFTS